MMALYNAQERTIGQFVKLVDGIGWKLESIGRGSRTAMAALVFNAVPV
jgi:hypothetical protein